MDPLRKSNNPSGLSAYKRAMGSNGIQHRCVLCGASHLSRCLFIVAVLFSSQRSTILQQQFNRVGRVEHGSVALPGVIRSGSIGTESLSVGTMPSAQQQITMGQMHRGHMPPLVRGVWGRRKLDALISPADFCNRFMFLNVQSSAQQALMGTINTSMQAVQKAQIDLDEVDNLPPLGQDMVSSF